MLRTHGMPVWHSRSNIVGARQWHDEIGSALKRCDWFIVVLSPESVEVYMGEVRIIPLLYQPRDYEKLSWTLSISQIVDFSRSFEEGCRDLLRVWGVGYNP